MIPSAAKDRYGWDNVWVGIPPRALRSFGMWIDQPLQPNQ
jgi:hypothetical protein